MKKALLLFLSLSLFSLSASAQLFNWAKKMGGSSGDSGNSIAVDAWGNVYTTGTFQGTADFNPGPGTFNLTSSGNSDIFISKLDSAGNFIWARKMGGSLIDESYSIAVDDSGNVYTTGLFLGTSDFDPGTGTASLSAAGGTDIFISKLDSAGNFVWAKRIGSSADEHGRYIKTDTAGNIYLTGYFKGTVDFDPGAGIFNLTSAGDKDIFIAKLNAAGNFIWAKSMGGSLTDDGYAIAFDATGNILLSGFFQGTVDFDTGAAMFNVTASGSSDAFICKLTALGDFIWVKRFGGSGAVFITSMVLDAVGSIYTTGYLQGAADFDPGTGISNLASAGNNDIFISKLDTAGNFAWAKRMGGVANEAAFSMALSSEGNLYTTGYFYGTVDFDPGAGTANLTSAGSDDIFISKLDTAGNFKWARRMGGNSTDRGFSMAIDASDNIYTTGFFYSTADFDPALTAFNLTSAGSGDAYVHKMAACINSYSTDVHTACSSYTWIDGVTYTASNNTATYTLPNAIGCDSIITLNLTITQPDSVTDTQTACDSFTWIDGNTYTSNNNSATFTLTNAAGCDSVVTLNLTIRNSSSGTDIQSACNAYTWIDGNTYTTSNNTATFTLQNAAGCDSVVTLNLTIKQNTTGVDVQNACGRFTWIHGITYTASNNTATHTLTNAAGCDSVVTL
ncbi:MAG: SBBP repeat-containing protein, partial [Hymenobacteraceae bacterium]|nr:SBBP repeat-containing protein [Hymenobacteraceae bacterium]